MDISCLLGENIVLWKIKNTIHEKYDKLKLNHCLKCKLRIKIKNILREDNW